jgi:acetylornithine deacetylase/succinyl-diaminopimelate desuccinylase-like protein
VGRPVLPGVDQCGPPTGVDHEVVHTPTVLFGLVDVRVAHRPDEYVPVEELEAAVRTLALTALCFCGYEA